MTPEQLAAKLTELNEHTVALVEFLEKVRGLDVHTGLSVLLLATAQIIGHVQQGENEAEADRKLEGFLEVVRQMARVRRNGRTL